MDFLLNVCCFSILFVLDTEVELILCKKHKVKGGRD